MRRVFREGYACQEAPFYKVVHDLSSFRVIERDLGNSRPDARLSAVVEDRDDFLDAVLAHLVSFLTHMLLVVRASPRWKQESKGPE